jgi:hypothetical protein
MVRLAPGFWGGVALCLSPAAQVQPFPANFNTQEIQTNGATLHVRAGRQGPALAYGGATGRHD